MNNHNPQFSLLIEKLDAIRFSTNGFSDGLAAAIRFTNDIGGSVSFIEDEDGGGVELSLEGVKVTVFQPYPDIDRIFYEY